MKIAVEGCAHGELEKIYETLQLIEEEQNLKVDLLICCGDFQATRNLYDLQTMAVPKKYQDMCTFYKYYKGECVAPVLTIFVGGNHEASNHLQELPYGGWVAPHIYYLGYAGVVRVNGIRIAGLSGIYKSQDFLRGHHEFSPYTEATRKSVYHVRQLEVFRLKQLSGNLDIFISHDWPHGIYNYGNKAQLIRFKPYFRDEVENDQMGSRPSEDLLKILKPSYWFAGHMHCKFSAIVPHENEEKLKDGCKELKKGRITKFLALDKCLPKRRFLQILDIESPETHNDDKLHFEYDIEWLTILYLTNHLINVKNSNYYMPVPMTGSEYKERHNFTPTEEERLHVKKKIGRTLLIPNNFCRTVEPYNPNETAFSQQQQPKAQINPQSEQFCDMLDIDDPLSLAMLISGHELSHSSNLDFSNTSLNDSSSLIIGEQSSIKSSCCTDISFNLSPNKRKLSTGMNLPKPITDDFLNSPENTSKEIGVHNPNELETKGNILRDAIDPNASVNDAESQDIVEKNTNLSKPPIKKFRRRNEEIYKKIEETM